MSQGLWFENPSYGKQQQAPAPQPVAQPQPVTPIENQAVAQPVVQPQVAPQQIQQQPANNVTIQTNQAQQPAANQQPAQPVAPQPVIQPKPIAQVNEIDDMIAKLEQNTQVNNNVNENRYKDLIVQQQKQIEELTGKKEVEQRQVEVDKLINTQKEQMMLQSQKIEQLETEMSQRQSVVNNNPNPYRQVSNSEKRDNIDLMDRADMSEKEKEDMFFKALGGRRI